MLGLFKTYYRYVINIYYDIVLFYVHKIAQLFLLVLDTVTNAA